MRKNYAKGVPVSYTHLDVYKRQPTGWRVASGELWLEFTNTGLNPGSMSDINYDDKFPNGYGMNMYMHHDNKKKMCIRDRVRTDCKICNVIIDYSYKV